MESRDCASSGVQGESPGGGGGLPPEADDTCYFVTVVRMA